MLIILETSNRGLLDIGRFTDPRARELVASLRGRFLPFTTVPLNVIMDGVAYSVYYDRVVPLLPASLVIPYDADNT